MKQIYPSLLLALLLSIGCNTLRAHAPKKTTSTIPAVNTGKSATTIPANINRPALPTPELPGKQNMNAGKQLSFIENKGQITDQHHQPRHDIQYSLAAGKGLTIFVGNGAIHYQWATALNPTANGTPIEKVRSKEHILPLEIDTTSVFYSMNRMDVELIGANKHAAITTEEKQDYYENYFTPGVGKDGATAHAYNRIIYKNVYPNIDWVLYTSTGQLKHEFVVHSDGKVSDIKLKYGGTSSLKITTEGTLIAKTPQGTITEQAPYTYQKDGTKVSSSFKLKGDVLSYETGEYNGELVIDPTLAWATYYGGSDYENGLGMTLDHSENVYVVGQTGSTANIATTGAYQITLNGGPYDAFLVKFNSLGARRWATYYGGSANEWLGPSICADANANIYISGQTYSTSGIATTGAYQTIFGGTYDAFLAKFDSSGGIQWATYYGGTGYDQGRQLAIDNDGNICMAGSTTSLSGIATTGAYQPSFGGDHDGFLVKFNSYGIRLWATYYGSSGNDFCETTGIDTSGNIFMVGKTNSTSGIATAGSHQATYGGGSGDAFLVKFSSLGVRQWATYYGGALEDDFNSISTDISNNIYMCGYTRSSVGIATSGVYQPVLSGSNRDAFLVKFDNYGNRTWGTYYGGTGIDESYSVAANGVDIYIVGQTNSTSNIATSGVYQSSLASGYDAYIANFDSTGNLNWATYYGGNGDDYLLEVSKSVSGSVYFAGYTNSASGIASSGSYQTAYGGGTFDAYLVKFNDCTLPSAGTITGPSSVNNGSTITLSDTTTGGTWSSSNTSIATIGSTGIVTGIAVGTVTISYTVSNSCGSTTTTTSITVTASCTNIITTIAGDGSYGYSGDDGMATAAQLSPAYGLCVDSTGNIYIADYGNQRIRKINTSGIITTIAGTGTIGYSGDGGPATSAMLGAPTDVNVDNLGNVFIADYVNERVRKISSTGIISTIAGNGTAGYSGDGGAATSAQLHGPTGIAVDINGNVYIADQYNNRVRKVSSTGVITTLAGNGSFGYYGDGGAATSAMLAAPTSVAVDGSGNVYIADYGNHVIRKINTSGIITTIAGNGSAGYTGDGVAATTTKLYYPYGVAIDGSSNLYIGDRFNNRVRKVNSAGTISTIAGIGSGGYSGDGSAATAAELNRPAGVTVDNSGKLYIADNNNRAIRKIDGASLVASVTGPSSVNTGASITLSNATIGGTWSSSNTAKATVNSTGLVSGITPGTATISYTVSNSCGSASATHTVTVTSSCSSIITTIAGNGTGGFSGDSGIATGAGINTYIGGVAVDGSGNVYIADHYNHRIRKVNSSGIISTFAGNGTAGFSGDGGMATAAELNRPAGIALDGLGNLYIVDEYNQRIRKVNSSGIISTVAGNGTIGYTGEGTATAVRLFYPTGVAADASGNVYIADQGNQRIRKVNTSGIISTIAGNGTSGYTGEGIATAVELYQPYDVALDTLGNIYIGDQGNQRIRKVNTSGIISTIAGNGTMGYSGEGIATSVELNDPNRIAVTPSGEVYISDQSNYRIRKVDLFGIISTVAGNGTLGFSGDGSSATSGQMNEPAGVAIDATGNIYVNDQANYRIRKITPSGYPSVAPITGSSSVNTGSTITLSHTTTGGSWSSSNTAIATVGSTGVVAGVSLGTATISYTVSNSCGSASATKVITVSSTCSSIITTIAGNGSAGYGGDGGSDTTAQLNYPSSVCVDKFGNIYIADAQNNRVRKIATDGVITTIAGVAGTGGYSGDGGPATAAQLNVPAGVAVDTLGNVFIADRLNWRVRKVNISGIITTVAGNGSYAFSGDGGMATAASVTDVWTLAVDRKGNLFIADHFGSPSRVRKISATGIISTYAGNGTTGTIGDGGPATAAPLNGGNIGSIDVYGNLYVTEAGGNRLRKIDTNGIIMTVAGNGVAGFSGDGGPATNAQISFPNGGACVDMAGNIYFADQVNNRIRKINTDGVISTFVGSGPTGVGTGGYGGDGGAPTSAVMNYPIQIALDGAGNFYITDHNNHRIRKVTSTANAGTVTGLSSVCVSSTTTLTDSVSGGIWNSSNTTIATVGSTGIVTGISSGTVTISYTVTNSCGMATATKNVTINPLPGAGTITGPSSVNTASTITLTNATTGGTWSSSNTSRATVGSTGVVAGVSLGTVTISYTVANSCGSASATKVVSVNLSLETPITGTFTVCAGATTTLSNATPGGTWSSGNTAVATVVPGTGVVTGVSAGTAVISYTLFGTSVTTVITVNAATSVAAITGTASFCAGATSALSSATTGGTWSSSNTTVANVGSTGIVVGISGGTAAISYMATGTCGTGYAVMIVEILSLPAPISGTASVCEGASTELSSSPGGGTWASSNEAIATVSNGFVSGISAGNATITYTAATGCYSTRHVTVHTTPAVITGTLTTCTGSTTTLSSATSGGTWASGHLLNATVASGTGVVTGVATGTAAISYSLSNGCRRKVTVTVIATPGAITGSMSLCAGNSSTLSSATTGGSWSSGATGIATVNTSTGIVTGVSAGTAIITYSTGSCSRTATVTVNAATGANTGNALLCVGQASSLSNSTGGGTWSSSDVAVATVAASTGLVTGIGAGTANITYMLSAGCYSLTEVTVNAAVASITGTLSACPGTTTTLANATTGGTWSSSNTTKATIDAGTGVATGVAAGSTTITYLVGAACYKTATLTVHAAPGNISGTASFCSGGSATLSCSPGGGTWSSSNTSVAAIGSTGVVTTISAGTSIISYTNIAGCASTKTVTVHAIPTAITGTLLVCIGNTSALASTPGDGTWTSYFTSRASINATTGVVTGVSIGTTPVTYTAPGGCSTTAIVTVGTTPAAITGILTVCVGNNTTLNSATTGGTWSSSDAGIATVAAGIVTGISTGTATISYTKGTCFRTTTVTVNAAPGANTGNAVVCVGQGTTLSNATGGGTWSSSNTGRATVNAATGIVAGVSAGTANISYRISAGCYSITVVTVNAAPANITGTLSVCPGATTTLAHPVSGGVWTSSNTAIGTIDAGTGIATGITTGSTIITYTLGTGCFRTATLTVNTAPGAITGTAAMCAGATTTLACSPGGGTWSSTTPSVATISSTGVVSGISAGNSTISYLTGTGCAATRQVTVSATPGSIGGTLAACTGSTTTLTAAPGGGTWSSSNTSIASIGSATGIVTGESTGTATITYSLSATCYVTATATINTTPAPITGILTVCTACNTTLSSLTGGGVWSSAATGIATIGAGTGIVSGVSTGTATISYILGGCSRTAVVSVNAAISPSFGTPVVCVGQTNATMGNPVPGGTWSSGNTAIVTIHAANGLLTGIGVGNANITYTTSPGMYTITVATVSPAVATITGTANICPGATVTLSNATSGGAWSSTNTASATVGAGTGIVTAVAAGTATISYFINVGCYKSITQVVNSVPNVTGASTVVNGTSTTFGGSPGGGTWSSANPAIASVSGAGVVTGNSIAATTITYTLSTGCFASRGITVVTSRPSSGDAESITQQAGHIKVYPNPTSGTLIIESGVGGVFTVFTIDGKEVERYAVTTKATTVSLPQHLAAGVYMCRFTGTDGTTAIVRLVYER